MKRTCICGAPKTAHNILCREGWAEVSSDDKAKLLGTASADLRRRIAIRLERVHMEAAHDRIRARLSEMDGPAAASRQAERLKRLRTPERTSPRA